MPVPMPHDSPVNQCNQGDVRGSSVGGFTKPIMPQPDQTPEANP